MADKFKKIDKEYKLTDDSVNCYGFRLLTAGYLMTEFEKNPIGYYMHERKAGVLLKWTDFRKEGDAIYAKPIINLSNPRGQQTVDEIENGFLNAASLGHFVVLETSDDPSLKLPNQTGLTVTKWYNRESSVVDIPGNFNSLIKLFDQDENEINLAAITNINFNQMKQIFLTAEQLGKLNLKAEATDAAAVEIAFNDLVAKAAKVEGLENQLATANKAVKDGEAKVVSLEKAAVTQSNEHFIDAAITAKKLGAGEKADYLELMDVAPETTKKLIDAKKPYESVEKQMGSKTLDDAKATKLGELMKLSYDELFATDQLEELKALDEPSYKLKAQAAGIKL